MKTGRSQAAFDLAEAGRFEESALAYEKVLPELSPDHWGTPLVFAEYAWVLTELDRLDDAATALEKALELEEVQSSGAPVHHARYRLAENRLLMGKYQEALDTLQPSIDSNTLAKLEFAVRALRAEALRELGRSREARAEARLAFQLAQTDEQRQAILDEFPSLLAGA